MPKTKIQPNDLLCTYNQYKKELEAAALKVLRSGWYVMGEHLSAFEHSFAGYNGVRYCVGTASGLDALWIALRVLGIGAGDEVIVPANTFIASVMAITINGATPVPIEPDEYYSIDPDHIEESITRKTKAVLAVHLYGIPCDMDRVGSICKKHGLILIEDCAQSHGARYKGQTTGTFGKVGCFSFYPTKNLGGFGDGGCIITDSAELDQKLRVFRNYGSQERYKNQTVGANSRLDEIQAAMLMVKLRHIDEIIAERREIAKRYNDRIRNTKIILPAERPDTVGVYHQYVVRCEDKRCRDRLIEYLKEKGIGTIIHYPIPPHLSEAYKYLGFTRGDFPITEMYADTVLSIPMYNGLSEDDQDYVIKNINEF